MSESVRKLIERLVSNILRVHGLQFQKNLHGGMIQGFLVELFHEKVMVSRKQLEDIVVGHCSGYYHCNRSSYGELKELLAGSGVEPENKKKEP